FQTDLDANFDNVNLNIDTHIQINSTSTLEDQVIIDKFRKCLSKVSGTDNFIFIGDAAIEVEDCEFSFEIFCRSNSKGDSSELDLLFNDVTRSKLIEKQNAEFQYKTLFLSKVAHEFKNPLICISEL